MCTLNAYHGVIKASSDQSLKIFIFTLTKRWNFIKSTSSFTFLISLFSLRYTNIKALKSTNTSTNTPTSKWPHTISFYLSIHLSIGFQDRHFDNNKRKEQVIQHTHTHNNHNNNNIAHSKWIGNSDWMKISFK